jgi:hypothetical protein
MRRFLVPVALAAALLAGQAGAQTAAPFGASSPGYVAPQIEPPAAFHGGQVMSVPPTQPLPQPNVGAPTFTPYPQAAPPRHKG